MKAKCPAQQQGTQWALARLGQANLRLLISLRLHPESFKKLIHIIFQSLIQQALLKWEVQLHVQALNESLQPTCSLSARTCSITLDHKATRPSSLSTVSGLFAERIKVCKNLFQARQLS